MKSSPESSAFPCLADFSFALKKISLAAEAVEKANPPAHFIPDYCLHQPIQKHV
jgi:hypothetical protein